MQNSFNILFSSFHALFILAHMYPSKLIVKASIIPTQYKCGICVLYILLILDIILIQTIFWLNWFSVLGDTSAGKSSLVNLIIAKDLLPYGVLSTSTTITQIFNSKERKAIVTYENGKQVQIINPTLEILKEHIGKDRSGQNTRRYKVERVDIYWPVPLLSVNLVFWWTLI